VINTDDGTVLADIGLGEIHAGVAFALDGQIYVGGESGALRVLTADRAGNFYLSNVWQGGAAIRKLAISPNGRILVIVDAQHVAQLLNIESGNIGTSTLNLPDAVSDILFSPSESRALFRTGRWIHRAGVSPGGLIWLDAIRAPKALAGSQMVFDQRNPNGASNPVGDRVMLLTRDAGFPKVAELQFSYSDGPALFGNKDRLLDEWRSKLGMGHTDD
jgi:hypothetical protein